MTETVQRRVAGVDVYNWTEAIEGDLRGRRERYEAQRGEVVTISADEAKRGESIVEKGIPALVPVDDAVVPAADQTAAEAFQPATEDQLAAMNVQDLTVYLSRVPAEQHADELDRILDVESQREKPRVGVLSLDPSFDPADVEPGA